MLARRQQASPTQLLQLVAVASSMLTTKQYAERPHLRREACDRGLQLLPRKRCRPMLSTPKHVYLKPTHLRREACDRGLQLLPRVARRLELLPQRLCRRARLGQLRLQLVALCAPEERQ